MKAITGVKKQLLIVRIILAVFVHFVPLLLKGKLSLWRFIQFCRRLLFFLKLLSPNKFFMLGKEYRLELYLPSFPSRAFFASCHKFLHFDTPMHPLTALISITSACRFQCAHCYQKLDKGQDMELNALIETVKKLQDRGVTFFNVEGGEPFLTYPRLKALCQAIDDRAEIWINSTGDGITKERLLELKQTPVKAIMFSLRSADPMQVNKLMGRDDAWEITQRAIELCHQCQIPVTTNSCLSKEDYYNGNFEKIMDLAKSMGASLLQIIHPKPAGGWLEAGADIFSAEDLSHIEQKIHMYNLNKKFRDYPAISAQIIEESAARFGCTAGGIDRFYLNAKGDLQPCEFLNISFGNVARDNLDEIFQKMRQVFHTPSSCWVCERYSRAVLQQMRENNLDRLPLDPELSKKIYHNWEMGRPTPAYQKILKMR